MPQHRNRWPLWSRRTRSVTAQAPARPATTERLEPRTLFATSAPGVQETLFTSTFSAATAMDFAPDGRLFVTQQGGAVRVIKDGELLPTPFATVNPDAFGERGLLGIAFDPDFAINKHVYVYWTATTPTTHNRISRFTANGDVAVPGSRVDIFDLPTLNATNHNGGAIHFGPDGKLYVGVGENAVRDNSQRLDNALGKLLRINKDGSIPSDNPFFNEATGQGKAIWALGLRNPYTFAFQPGTGKMYINDVGFNRYEEVNEGVRGANYGWPTTEGPTTDPRFKGPVHAYLQKDAGGEGDAITGGAFYNPPAGSTAALPASYAGDYFFADYSGNFIKHRDAATGAVTTWATSLGGPVDLKVGPDGALYALGRNGQKVYRFAGTNTGGNPGTPTAPTVTDPPDAVTVSPGVPATFSVEASGTAPLTYQWQRNGQNIAGATSDTYTLQSPQNSDNNAEFRVVVTNAAGSVTSPAAKLTVSANAAPVATITSPAAGTIYRAGQRYSFAATATDAEDGSALPDSAFDWELVFHHQTHTHPFLTVNDKRTGEFTIPNNDEVSHEVFYRLNLTVTDSGGRTTTVSRDIQPNVVTMNFATNVPGLQLSLDSAAPVDAPIATQGVTGVLRAIAAPPTQTVGGVTYNFASWSDGGAATHGLTTPESTTTYTATYQPAGVGGTPGGAVDLAAAITSTQPESVLAGSKGKATVRVTNNAAAKYTGGTTVTLLASADGALDAGDTTLATLTKSLKLGAGKGRNVKLKFDYPQNADGSYTLFARVDSAAGADATPADNAAPAAAPVTIAPAFVDLSATLLPTTTPELVSGQRQSATITVTNAGNTTASGPLTIRLAASANSAWDESDAQLAEVTKNLRLQPGASKRFNLRFPIPDPLVLPPTYRYAAGIDTSSQITESDETNNTAAAEPVTAR